MSVILILQELFYFMACDSTFSGKIDIWQLYP